jgi:solute carrier family 25 carnitine/acylcarnitine transporter 20/29
METVQKPSFNNNLVRFVPGAVGGICNVLVGQPIDLIKVMAQTAGSQVKEVVTEKKRGTFGTMRKIVIRDGFMALYTGVAAPLVASAPTFAITFASFDFAKSVLIQGENRQMTPLESCAAGGFSGFSMLIIRAPTERVKCLMQAQTNEIALGRTALYNSSLDCAKQLYREGGLRNIFQGSIATAARDIPGNAAYFGTYELARRQILWVEKILRNEDDISVPPAGNEFSVGSTMIAGGLAGMANWVVAIPMDVVKSRLQAAPLGKYTGAIDVLRQLWNTDGPRALFRGLSPALIRAFPANTACFLGVEMARQVMGAPEESQVKKGANISRTFTCAAH